MLGHVKSLDVCEMKKNKPLTVVDLFAGCGGFSLGLENAGFQTVFVNEIDDDARDSFIRNRLTCNELLSDKRFHSADIKDMVLGKGALARLWKALNVEFGLVKGELDLVVGGPPCQGFSLIGHRRSYQVDKELQPSNYLFEDMAYIIDSLRPRAFVFENVRGLLKARWAQGGTQGEIWARVLQTFQMLRGYDIAWELLFAKNYGVPQNRPRVILVGVRRDVKSSMLIDRDRLSMASKGDAIERGFLPPSKSNPPTLGALLDDLIDPNYQNGGRTLNYPNPARSDFQRMLRTPKGGGQPFPKGSVLTEQDYTKHSEKIVEKFSLMQSGAKKLFPDEFKTKKFVQRVLPREWGPVGPNITITSLPDDFVHYSQPRILTVREWARMQLFPDWYQFSGKRTTGGIWRAGNPRLGFHERELPKYTQIANAVPVGLAQAIGSHLAKILGR